MEAAMANLDFTNHELVRLENEKLQKKKNELDEKFAEWERLSQGEC
jgi:hypothetical protein